MRTSDSINELATALSAAQGEMKAAPMTGRNPHLKNKYTTLNDIIDTARPVLFKHGLAYVQMPTSPSDLAFAMIGLTTRLMHKSGQWLEDDMYFPVDPGSNRAVNPAQVSGSTITYMRRYALAAMLGIVADEDADGEQPERKEQQAPAQAKAQQAPATPPAVSIQDALDEDVAAATAAEFVGTVAKIVEIAPDAVKQRLQELGYNKIPGKPEERVMAFHAIRDYKPAPVAEAHDAPLFPDQPNGAYRE